jgi:hypothetical protein
MTLVYTSTGVPPHGGADIAKVLPQLAYSQKSDRKLFADPSPAGQNTETTGSHRIGNSPLGSE